MSMEIVRSAPLNKPIERTLNDNTSLDWWDMQVISRRDVLSWIAKIWVFAYFWLTALLTPTKWNALGKKTELFYKTFSLENLLKEKVYNRLVLLSNIPVSYYWKPESEIVEYLLTHNVQLILDRFGNCESFLKHLSLSDIIPNSIGSIQIDWSVPWYRLDGQLWLNTKWEFYTSFRPVWWHLLSAYEKSIFTKNNGNAHVLEENSMLGLRMWSKIKCIDRKNDQKITTEVVLDESIFDPDELIRLHKDVDAKLCVRSSIDNWTKYISCDTRPADVVTMNLWLKRFMCKLLEKFPLLVISSWRRSVLNNKKSGGIGNSRHLYWVAFDLVTTWMKKPEDSANYLNNVEAYLIAHWLNSKFFIDCYWTNYHIHLNTYIYRLPESYIIADSAKTLDLRLKNWSIMYKCRVWKGWELQYRLSKSDVALLERYWFSQEAILLFFKSNQQVLAKQALKWLDIKKMAFESIWVSDVKAA